jgi:20S proteasome alpha/beta subunit
MTTLVGIQTNSGPIDAIVLGTDTQMATFEDEKLVSKKPLYKIVTGDFWAIAHCGAVTDSLKKFYNRLKYPERTKDYEKGKLKDVIETSIKEKRFMEVDKLNAEYYRKTEDSDDSHEFLFVTYDRLRLFHIDCYGNLKQPEDERQYLALGTGEQLASGYIEEKLDGETYDSTEITLEVAMQLCRNSLKIASNTDIYSGGPMDIYVFKKGKMSTSFGKRLGNALEVAENKEFEKFLKEQTDGDNKK